MTKHSFDCHLKPPEVKKRESIRDLDQQVNVAIRPILAASDRAENAHVGGSRFLYLLKNQVAVFDNLATEICLRQKARRGEFEQSRDFRLTPSQACGDLSLGHPQLVSVGDCVHKQLARLRAQLISGLRRVGKPPLHDCMNVSG